MAMSSANIVVMASVGMSVLCFLVAFAAQDWSGKVGPTTGGKNDATVGTYVTDYLLGLECFIMAAVSIGTQGSIAVAYMVGGISWIAGGVLHHIFPTHGQMHVTMWIVALIFGGWSSLIRTYALIVTAQASGKCTSCDWKLWNKLLIILFSAIAFIFAGAVIVSVLNEAFPVADWMLLAMKKLVMDLAFIIIGFATCEIPWSFACLAAMIFFVVLNVVKFAPFIYSATFNDNSLFHTGVMLFLAMTFGLFNSLAQTSTGALLSAGAE